MQKTIALTLVASLTLAGCGNWSNSRANPTNWFGKSKSTSVAETDANVNPLIPQTDRVSLFNRGDAEAEDTSVLVGSVSDLNVEPTPIGAIIYATGVAQRQGAFAVSLQKIEDESTEGTLSYSFRVNYPEYATPVGSETVRTVRAAVSLSHQDLAGVRLIRVVGAENARESRRR